MNKYKLWRLGFNYWFAARVITGLIIFNLFRQLSVINDGLDGIGVGIDLLFIVLIGIILIGFLPLYLRQRISKYNDNNLLMLGLDMIILPILGTYIMGNVIDLPDILVIFVLYYLAITYFYFKVIRRFRN